MSQVPELPLFMASDEDADIWVAKSVAWAEGDMEPPEVEEGYHIVFDAQGRRATLTVEQWSVKITGWSETRDLPGLMRRIRRHLAMRGLREPATNDASQYVQQAARVIAASQRPWLHVKWDNFRRRPGRTEND